MATLRVTQIKSANRVKRNQAETLRTLGLKKIGDVVEKEDLPQYRGMVNTVIHLVSVEEVD
ncbi:50S ribosomal protein L30 [Propioniciclava sp.]|uniref:50S ribosomal protein L30 n=1 Tax=Propioniciclava sp. TaxID=2038686 RepID=UPI002626AFE2|nr:50S ribosomal protein L30 [Propioniciclava sp.]